MKVKVVTTLHEDGYKIYGKNLGTWSNFFPQDWTLEYYAENHTPDLNARFTVKDFNKSCPDWDEFYNYVKLQTVDLTDKKKINWYKKALRWSFKMYTILDSLKNSQERYLIWIDADASVYNNVNLNWILNSLKNHCLAAKLEKIKNVPHIESGILIFDRQHTDINKIINWIEKGYLHKQIFNEPKAWDGFWLAKMIQTQEINWVNKDLFKGIMIHSKGDKKFHSKYDSRSGRSQNNELI